MGPRDFQIVQHEKYGVKYYTIQKVVMRLLSIVPIWRTIRNPYTGSRKLFFSLNEAKDYVETESGLNDIRKGIINDFRLK